ncbi:Alpha/Beta hydrolase protein [Aspergillus karnatakaensis]|uniref:lipase family protein n=1 Tax=Aspergillus karnatakaensis TaxID=1810916 RepID=UPI003CCCE371
MHENRIARPLLLYTTALLLLLPPWASQSVAQEVSQATIDRFNIFAQYSAAAGCDQNNNSTDSPIVTCDYYCPLVIDYNVTTLYEFNDRGWWTDTTGYVALDETRKLIVLVFRGSVSSDSWRTDLTAIPIWLLTLCPFCWVHAGFHSAWDAVRRDVVRELKRAVDAHSDYQLFFTGHSLGGAIATVAATLLKGEREWENWGIQLVGFFSGLWYTFGAPVIGNRATAKKTTKLVSVFRATHENDPVPKLPPELAFPADYVQPSPEYWITSDNGEPVTVGDVDYVEGVGSEGGNRGTEGNDASNHMWYFGNMTVCAKPVDVCSGWWCIIGNWFQ